MQVLELDSPRLVDCLQGFADSLITNGLVVDEVREAFYRPPSSVSVPDREDTA